MKPHKHSEVIKAFVDGVQCEKWSKTHDKWLNVINFYDFDLYDTVRIKPEPAEDVVDYLFVHDNSAYLQSNPKVDFAYTNKSNLKLTWDGESGKLKYAEVIK
jgi:hypothetical protein